MYVLSIITAVFLPLGFLKGLLGVNLAGIPGAENNQAFTWFFRCIVGFDCNTVFDFKIQKVVLI